MCSKEHIPRGAHGNVCSCQLLSLAVTGKLDGCDYEYCRNVLQRHWKVRCNHGQSKAVEDAPIYEVVTLHEDATLELLKKMLR